MLSRLNRLPKSRSFFCQPLKLTPIATSPFTPFQSTTFRPLTTTPTLKMPEPLHSSEVTSKTDPSVSKQYDTAASFETKFEDFYGIVDKLKIGLLGTYRPNVGPVHRSMAVAKRTGPDFLFLANLHSQKFRDIEDGKEIVSVSFQNSGTQDWVSVTGKAVKTTGEDPRIREVWTKGTKAWFGDLGDGKHDGGPEDPRMGLIVVQANCEFCVCR